MTEGMKPVPCLPVWPLLFAALACARVPSSKELPVKVYVAHAIHTGDEARPRAQALAVEGKAVFAVGSEAHVRERLAGRAAEWVRVEGVITPGIEDAHCHLDSLGRRLTVADLSRARSEAEAVAAAAAAGPESRQGDWVVGRGWDQNDWGSLEGPHPFPGRALLDRALPTTPAWLVRVDGHAAWVNGEALRRAGITRDTPEPAGGRILKDERGEPTGVLVDNAMGLVSAHLPPPSEEQREARLEAAFRRVLAGGITAVHDAGMDLETFRVLQRWDAVGALPLRIYAMADGQGPDGDALLQRGPFQGGFLSMKAAKLFADGALGSRGAALLAPYSDDPAETGLLLLSPEQLQARAAAFMGAGFQVAIHAIGDRANRVALDALAGAARETGGGPGRHRLEHAQVLAPEDLPRLAKEGVIASMQPTHATSDMPWAEARLGPVRLEGAYAWRTVLQSGARLCFGSDFPVEEPEPLPGFYAARTRQDGRGLPEGGWLPGQRLTGEETLRAFTREAAFAAFAEGQRGVLREGMAADFSAFSVDPVACEPAALLTARTLLTVVAGREVYTSGP
jgi:predicted amidohydrolase YtcJ